MSTNPFDKFVGGLAGGGAYYAQRDGRALARERFELDEDIFEENKRSAGVIEAQNNRRLDREDRQQENLDRQQDNVDADEQRKQYKFDTENKQNKANNVVSLAMDQKWWTPASGIATFNRSNYQISLDSDNTVNADRMALHVANMQAKDPNFVFDNVRRKNGKIYIEGTYVDGPNKGEKGVANESGDANPNSPVLEYTSETLTNDVASEWVGITSRSSVLSGENGIRFLAANGAGQDRLQSVRDIKEARLQTIVEDAAEGASRQAGSLDLVRGFKRALANAGEDKEARRKILLDMADTLGVDTTGTDFAEAPSTIVGNAAPEEIIGAKGAMGGYTPKSASSKVKQYNSNIARLENKIAKGGSDEQLEKYYTEIEQSIAARTELINDTNQKSLSDSQTRVTDLTAKAEKATGGRKEFWNKQLAKEQTKLDELIKAGVVTPAMKTEAWADLRSRVLDNIETMNPEQVDAMVESGKIEFTPEDVSAMKQRAEELRIRTIEDIAKLPTKEQIGFRALLGVISESPAERDYMRETLDNLTETGSMSISAQDEASNRINAVSAETNRLKVQRGLDEAQERKASIKRVAYNTAADNAEKFHDEIVPLLYDMDGDGRLFQDADKARIASRIIVGHMLKLTKLKVDSPEYKVAMWPVSSAISNLVAIYAEDGKSTFGQELLSFFRPDPTGDAGDFDLSRVTVDDPENPTMLFYRNSATDADGSNVGVIEGAGFKIKDFSNDISKGLAAVIVEQARLNTKARNGS